MSRAERERGVRKKVTNCARIGERICVLLGERRPCVAATYCTVYYNVGISWGSPGDPPEVKAYTRGILRGSLGDPQGIFRGSSIVWHWHNCDSFFLPTPRRCSLPACPEEGARSRLIDTYPPMDLLAPGGASARTPHTHAHTQRYCCHEREFFFGKTCAIFVGANLWARISPDAHIKRGCCLAIVCPCAPIRTVMSFYYNAELQYLQ